MRRERRRSVEKTIRSDVRNDGKLKISVEEIERRIGKRRRKMKDEIFDILKRRTRKKVRKRGKNVEMIR